MRQADLDRRAELVRDGSLFDGYDERMAEVHREHNARLQAILTEHGWPGRSLVGEEGAAAAWFLLQHAVLAPELMRAAVVLVERAVATGDCDAKYLAFLTDRIRTLEGRPQLYGTQHDWDPQGQLSPLPIEAPETVGERRQSVGLESLEENTSRLRAQAMAEGEQPPADYYERQRQLERWAKSVGWR
jgi:hypothetical protein